MPPVSSSNESPAPFYLPSVVVDGEHSPKYVLSDFFYAIEQGDSEKVREMLSEHKNLAWAKFKSDSWKWDSEYELDAYKLLGAYLGKLSGLQLAILKGYEDIAADIVDMTLGSEALNSTFGGQNTALHLATFLGYKSLVKLLLDRGADRFAKNSKGFTPVDMIDDSAEMRSLYDDKT